MIARLGKCWPGFSWNVVVNWLLQGGSLKRGVGGQEEAASSPGKKQRRLQDSPPQASPFQNAGTETNLKLAVFIIIIIYILAMLAYVSIRQYLLARSTWFTHYAEYKKEYRCEKQKNRTKQFYTTEFTGTDGLYKEHRMLIKENKNFKPGVKILYGVIVSIYRLSCRKPLGPTRFFMFLSKDFLYIQFFYSEKFIFV